MHSAFGTLRTRTSITAAAISNATKTIAAMIGQTVGSEL